MKTVPILFWNHSWGVVQNLILGIGQALSRAGFKVVHLRYGTPELADEIRTALAIAEQMNFVPRQLDFRARARQNGINIGIPDCSRAIPCWWYGVDVLGHKTWRTVLPQLSTLPREHLCRL